MESIFVLLVAVGYIVFAIIRSNKISGRLRDISDGVSDVSAKIEYLERKIERLAAVGGKSDSESTVAKVSPELEPMPEPCAAPESLAFIEEEDTELSEIFDIDADEPEAAVCEPVPAPTPASAPQGTGADMERFIGVNLFSKIGIAVLVLGIGFFVKYAIDNSWIGEVARTVLGLVSGAALWSVSYFLKDKYRSFSSVLAGGGFAVSFVTIAVAYNFYGIFSSLIAFIVLIALVIAEIAVALWYKRRELAAVGIVAAFAAPFLSAGPDGSTVAFTGYVLVLSAAIFVVSFRRPSWYELPLIGCVLSWIIAAMAAVSVREGESHAMILVFDTLIFIIYSLPLSNILGLSPEGKKHVGAIVGAMFVNNFVYVIAGLRLMKGVAVPWHADGIVPLVAALADGFVFYRYYMKKQPSLPQDILMLLIAVSSCLVFPVQFRSQCVSIAAVAFYTFAMNYLYCRTGRRIFKVLVLLCIIALVFALEQLRLFDSPLSVFFSYAFTGAALISCAATLSFYRAAYSPDHGLVYTSVLWLGILSCVYGTFTLIEPSLGGVSAFRGAVAVYLAASLALAVLSDRGGNAGWLLPVLSAAGIACVCMPCSDTGTAGTVLFWVCMALYPFAIVIQSRKCYGNVYFGPFGKNLFTVLLIASAAIVAIAAAFNILMLCSLRNLNSAAVSVLLSLAGAATIAVGLRRHDKALRLTGLGLFGIVLVKLVAYDLWKMPSVGRIIVFIILGILLLAISFLYNKLRRALFDD